MPKVFIIILNWNGWQDTMECLESLNNISYDNFEVLLIDNASKEKITILDSRFPRLKITQIFNDLNLGYAGGNNQGIKMALERGADYVLLLNNDTIVESDFLTQLIAAAENNKEAGIFGSKIYFYDSRLARLAEAPAKRATSDKLIWSAGGKITKNFTRGELIGYCQNDEGQHDQIKEADYISGTCLLAKKEIVEKIGSISEDYFLYYEDADWCLRARWAGYRCLFVPKSIIYHKVSKSTGEFSFPYIYYHSRNGLIFGSRFGLKPAIYIISLWIFFKQLIKLIIGYKKDWARPVMKGVLDFWRGKIGKLEGYY